MVGDLQLPTVGQIKLRGVVGSPVSADLVRLNVSLSDENYDNDCTTILCAVCSEANDDLILTSKVVDSLFNRQAHANIINALQHDDDEDDDNNNNNNNTAFV